MKRLSTLAFFVTIFFILLTAVRGFAAEYEHQISLQKMIFDWRLENERIYIRLKAATKGWVAIGFNPENGMEGADFVIGYVKRGKVKIEDAYGVRHTQHIRDELNQGENNIEDVSGKEFGGFTELMFSIPLNSGDSSDKPIDPDGETTVLLAFGPDRDSMHSRHTFRTTLKVNLAKGTVQ